ncbi:MAG TPA: response regulator [Kofleriaceae bacterium]|nr:response regulator [Kofleriaceae bacterium]
MTIDRACARVPEATDRRRVLVVDDQPDVVEIICVLFEQMGHECVSADTGQGAIDAAIVHQPDIVVLDIGLPDLSGYEVVRTLRAMPCGADLYIAALTGWGAEADRQRALASGFDQHLTKPANQAMLAAMVAAAAQRRLPAAMLSVVAHR